MSIICASSVGGQAGRAWGEFTLWWCPSDRMVMKSPGTWEHRLLGMWEGMLGLVCP